MLKKIFSIALLFFAFSFLAVAQVPVKTLKDIEQVKKLSTEAANLFKDKKIKESVEKMRPYWPIEDEEIAAFQEKTEGYMTMLISSYGVVEGVQKLKEETISDFAFRETYVLRYQYSAIRLTFTYFKSSQGWILNSFKWDEEYEELFKQK